MAVSNLFLLPGPNTGLGHSSVVICWRRRIDALTAIVYMRRNGVTAIEARSRRRRLMSPALIRVCAAVWTFGGCLGWYLDTTGRNSRCTDTQWRFRRRVALRSTRIRDGIGQAGVLTNQCLVSDIVVYIEASKISTVEPRACLPRILFFCALRATQSQVSRARKSSTCAAWQTNLRWP